MSPPTNQHPFFTGPFLSPNQQYQNFASLQLFVLKALAEVQALKTTVQSKDEMIKLLTKERDQALATLNRNGLMADRNIEVCSTSASTSI